MSIVGRARTLRPLLHIAEWRVRALRVYSEREIVGIIHASRTRARTYVRYLPTPVCRAAREHRRSRLAPAARYNAGSPSPSHCDNTHAYAHTRAYNWSGSRRVYDSVALAAEKPEAMQRQVYGFRGASCNVRTSWDDAAAVGLWHLPSFSSSSAATDTTIVAYIQCVCCCSIPCYIKQLYYSTALYYIYNSIRSNNGSLRKKRNSKKIPSCCRLCCIMYIILYRFARDENNYRALIFSFSFWVFLLYLNRLDGENLTGGGGFVHYVFRLVLYYSFFIWSGNVSENHAQKTIKNK